MRRIITILLGTMLLLLTQSVYAQVHKSGNATVTNDREEKVGTQFVSINLNQFGTSTVTIGKLKMIAKVFTIQRNPQYGIVAYGVTLKASNGKTVDSVINTYTSSNHITMVVQFGDGKKRYEF